MNIYICNCPNTFNYGSMMMGENFISYFNQVSGTENNYYVETLDQINVERLKVATGVRNIYEVSMNSLFKEGVSKYDYLLSFLNLKCILSNFINEIDLVVVLGGDDFTEDYGWKSPVLKGMMLSILSREGLPVIMLGQTMGPYRYFRRPIMKNILKRIDMIYPRDPITFEYLQGLGLKNIDITEDLALLPLTRQEQKEKTKEFITYCPSELIYRYAKEGGRKKWVDFNLFMIDQIMSRYKDKKLVLLAHVLKPEDADDRKIVNELYSLVEGKYKGRVIAENKEMFPLDVRQYIQKSIFTISSRMHPVVSSIQCEVPAIALSYSSKYWGIIGEGYGLGDYILDVRHLGYNEMKNNFKKLIDKIDSEYNSIQVKMKEKNIIAKNKNMKVLKEISTVRR